MENDEALAVIDNVNYLGYLSFVGYDITLPVIAGWSFDALNYTPARYSGTVKNNDLVVAAHNYYSHFFLLNEMVKGNEVDLTQADGSIIRYIVKKVETLEPTELNKPALTEYHMHRGSLSIDRGINAISHFSSHILLYC